MLPTLFRSYTGADQEFAGKALRAKAEHEVEHPVPGQVGAYAVDVVRTSSRFATISVETVGPANAELLALAEAGNHCFSSESEADYESGGVSDFSLKVKEGSQYQWGDPDSAGDSDCSCLVTVTQIDSDMARVKRDDGTDFEVVISELA